MNERDEQRLEELRESPPTTLSELTELLRLLSRESDAEYYDCHDAGDSYAAGYHLGKSLGWSSAAYAVEEFEKRQQKR